MDATTPGIKTISQSNHNGHLNGSIADGVGDRGGGGGGGGDGGGGGYAVDVTGMWINVFYGLWWRRWWFMRLMVRAYISLGSELVTSNSESTLIIYIVLKCTVIWGGEFR